MDGVCCIIFKFSSLIVCLARIEFQVSFLKKCFRFPNDIFQGKASFLIRTQTSHNRGGASFYTKMSADNSGSHSFAACTVS